MHFLHVLFSSVLVQETELWLTCSVLFGQNGKTLLRLVTILETNWCSRSWDKFTTLCCFCFFAASFFRFPTLLVLQNKCRHFSCIWSLFLVLGRLFSEIYFNPFPICNHFIKRLFEISPTNLLNKWIEKVNQIII